MWCGALMAIANLTVAVAVGVEVEVAGLWMCLVQVPCRGARWSWLWR